MLFATKPIFRRLAAWTLALGLCATATYAAPISAALPVAGAEKDEIPFEELAQSFLDKRSPNGEMASLDEVLAHSFATVRLGAFQIAVPADFLAERSRSKEVPEVSIGVLELQQLWVETLCKDEAVVKSVQEDVATLKAWLDGWKYTTYSKVENADDKDLYIALDADEEVKAASARLAETMMSREKVGIAPQYTDVIRILLSPTRRDFMEFVGYGGKYDLDSKKRNWVQSVDQFTQVWVKRTLVLSMEYAPWGDQGNGYNVGMPMTKSDKNGLLQHVVQQATRALVFTSFNRNDMALLEKGLGVHFTIAICGIANTIDGEGSISDSGATTQPYERFVPGGNPNGGVLPAIPAAAFNMTLANHWREGLGKDYFIKPLRKGQKAGSKRAAKEKDNPLRKDKRPHFALEGDSGSRALITAPFLGKLAYEKQYPDADFMNDYREFYRSYQACFLYWLERHGDPESEAGSVEKFRSMIVRFGNEPGLEMDTAAKEIYGIELSGVDDVIDSLEWRFLTWLEQQ